jgi:hypothetical protein
MPNLFFADLVREHCHEGGAGVLTPAGALPGHRAFADAVPAETPFHYAIAGVAFAGEWEVGTGRIDGAGRLVRESVASSSADGAAVDFTPGLKTLALTVGADWFTARDTGAAAIEAALGGKQPVSTAHAGAADGAAGDLITVRRGDGWVNIPITALAYRGADGAVTAGGPLACPAGSAAAPALSFAADANTGLFNAAADTIGFATGGTERMRITSAGLGFGAVAPYAAIEIAKPAGEVALGLGSVPGVSSIGLDMFGSLDAIPAAQVRAFIGAGSSMIGVNGDLLIAPRTSAGSRIRFLTGATGGVDRWIIQASGTIQPGGDNAYDMGTSSARVRTYYGVTGAINTSDGREKTEIRTLTAAELRAAKRIGASIGIYQFLASIAEKGEAGARLHCGVIAQKAWAIMADEGLIDPIIEGVEPDSRYAFLCWDSWEAETTQAGAVIRPAGDRFGIRPDQLALFLIAGQEARIAVLEAAA